MLNYGTEVKIKVIITIISIILCLILLLASIFSLEKYSCHQSANAMSLKYLYRPSIGCMVQADNHYYDIDNYLTVRGLDKNE